MFGMVDCKMVSTLAVLKCHTVSEVSDPLNQIQYQDLLEALLNLSTSSRPDISVSVNLLCRERDKPQSTDMIAALRV